MPKKVDKRFVSFADKARSVRFGSEMIVINRCSFYNWQSKLRENFNLRYLQFLGLRVREKSRCTLQESRLTLENRVARDAIYVSREGGNFPLSGTVGTCSLCWKVIIYMQILYVHVLVHLI